MRIRLGWMIAAVMPAAGGSFGGCTFYIPHQIAASNAPLDPPAYEVVGPVSGEACRSFLLLFIPLGGSNRLQAAIDRALEKSRGDALIEVTTDYKIFTFYPLIQRQCTLVNGLAVRRLDKLHAR